MPSSTLTEWVKEREQSPYRASLYNQGGVYIMHQIPDHPLDVTKVSFYNIFTKNRLLFEPITLEMDFPKPFHHQPKKLSMNLYRDISLWQVLLILNKCRSEIDFHGERVKYLDPDQVMSYMSRMFVDEDVNTTIY